MWDTSTIQWECLPMTSHLMPPDRDSSSERQCDCEIKKWTSKCKNIFQMKISLPVITVQPYRRFLGHMIAILKSMGSCILYAKVEQNHANVHREQGPLSLQPGNTSFHSFSNVLIYWLSGVFHLEFKFHFCCYWRWWLYESSSVHILWLKGRIPVS